MSSEHIAVTGLALTAVGLVVSLLLLVFRSARQLGALENQVSTNTAEVKKMATKHDLDNQTAAVREEFSGQTKILDAKFTGQTETMRAEFASQTAVIKAEIAGLEKRNGDRFDRLDSELVNMRGIKDEIKDLKTTLQVRSEKGLG